MAVAELVEQVKNGSSVGQPVSWLMRSADAISNREALPAAPLVSAQANVAEAVADTFMHPHHLVVDAAICLGRTVAYCGHCGTTRDDFLVKIQE